MSGSRKVSGLVSLSALLGAAACSSLIGIEDVHQGPAPGSDAGASEAGADTAGMAGHSAANGGASAGQAGSSGAGGASAGGASAGGGVGGSSGGATGGSAVHGTVIDFWGHHLPAVPIAIDGKQTTTDAQGAFTVENVGATYDASLLIQYMAGKPRKLGWVFQGLSRRDPTLQVYEGLPDKQGALDIQPNNPATLTNDRTLTVALGGPDGASRHSDVSGPGTDGSTIAWQGPDETQMTAYALIWEQDPDTDFPTKFIAYDSTLVALSSKTVTHSKASFNLAADSIANATIGGKVTGSGFADRTNLVYLRFPSNAVMKLLDHHPTIDGFSYVVPTIAGATATFAASDGDVYSDYGVVHKDGLAPNTANISAAIPTPARMLGAAPDINSVSATTQFSFKAGNSGSVPFVASFTLVDTDVDERLYVVSAKAPFLLPGNAMYALKAGETYSWHIETHGAPANVDAMAGPMGFLDSFSNSNFDDEPQGPSMGDGSFTQSATVNVKLAP